MAQRGRRLVVLVVLATSVACIGVQAPAGTTSDADSAAPRFIRVAQAEPVPRPRHPGIPPAGPPPATDFPLEVPATGPITRQDLLMPPATPQGSRMSPEIASALREIGPRIEVPRTTALYASLHAALNHDRVEVRADQAYGPHERHRADVFLPKARGSARPMLVFVHGGGFARGAKNNPGQFYYDNVGYWAASNDLVGVTLNYRLAPEFAYPAGAEDMARAVAWLREQAAGWGADPERIFLFGHSAGGAHVADYLVRTPRAPVAGAILMSGIYDLGTEKSAWSAYYGEDVSQYPARSSLSRLVDVPLPMMVVWAELDPPDFVPDSERLVAGRRAASQPVLPLRLGNHSHLSEAYAIGTQDQSLTTPLLNFIHSALALRQTN